MGTSNAGSGDSAANQSAQLDELQQIEAKTHELWRGRTSDGGVAARLRSPIVSAACTNSVSEWKAITAGAGSFEHSTGTMSGQLTVTGASGDSVFAQSIQTLFSTIDRTQTDLCFGFGASHADNIFEIGIFSCDAPDRGIVLAEQGGSYSITIYDNGAPVTPIPITPAYALNLSPHRLTIEAQGSQMSHGTTRILLDDELLFQAPPGPVTLPLRATRGFALIARVRCVGTSVPATMYLGDGAAYSFTDPPYPFVEEPASREASLALTSSFLPLVVVRPAKTLPGNMTSRPTLWPTEWNALVTTAGGSAGRFGVFLNNTGTTRVTGGTWVPAADGKLFDENVTATDFDTTGLRSIRGQIPIGTNVEGVLVTQRLDGSFRIGGQALGVWPDASLFQQEFALCAVRDSGSVDVKRATVLVRQPGRGPL